MKDYIDLSALFESGISLGIAINAAQQIFGERFNPQISLKALCFFGDGNLVGLPESTKQHILSEVKKINLDHLPPLP